MSEQVFQQDPDDKKAPQPGGPYLVQMLFKEPVPMPDKESMTAVMQRHIGAVECFGHDKKMTGFSALDHIAEFKEGKAPVQLMVMDCIEFTGKGIDAFLMSQMWDCRKDRERILRECKYQVVATDMLAGALPALERANLDADFVEALAELYPDCEAFFFQNCGKLLLAEDVRSHQIEGPDRFIRFGVNVRFFNIQGTEDIGLSDVTNLNENGLPAYLENKFENAFSLCLQYKERRSLWTDIISLLDSDPIFRENEISSLCSQALSTGKERTKYGLHNWG